MESNQFPSEFLTEIAMMVRHCLFHNCHWYTTWTFALFFKKKGYLYTIFYSQTTGSYMWACYSPILSLPASYLVPSSCII